MNTMRFLFVLVFFFLAVALEANYLRIQNVTILGQDKVNHFTKIQFDLGWDHSWRDDANHDAAWIFIKYTTDGGASWWHSTLSASAGHHTAPGGSTITPSTDGRGVFMSRASNGSGSNSFTGVQLRWNYGVDGVPDTAVVKVKVLALEMVYIPTGSVYVGDGNDSTGTFEKGNSNTPFRILDESAITLGGTAITNLSNHNSANDDFDYSSTATLPATFPKGYQAFYMMKHELTQEMYRDFLNSLSRVQQLNRIRSTIPISGGPVTNYYVMTNTGAPPSGHVAWYNGIRCDFTVSPQQHLPLKFYCDGNGSGYFDEPDDRQYYPVNGVTEGDLLAFSDWAGLRPMSELEYEKACRGDRPPVPNEFAWGGIFAIPQRATVSSFGTSNEMTDSETENCNISVYYASVPPSIRKYWVTGMLRAGIFAREASPREQAGAGYFGALDLTGSLLELTVSVGTATGRAFTGTHGDGQLSFSGSHTNADWPTAGGISERGGSFDTQELAGGCVSWRKNAIATSPSDFRGIRCVRTAP
jgi:formylglycine-generating enzyme required for sulfatase activity